MADSFSQIGGIGNYSESEEGSAYAQPKQPVQATPTQPVVQNTTQTTQFETSNSSFGSSKPGEFKSLDELFSNSSPSFQPVTENLANKSQNSSNGSLHFDREDHAKENCTHCAEAEAQDRIKKHMEQFQKMVDDTTPEQNLAAVFPSVKFEIKKAEVKEEPVIEQAPQPKKSPSKLPSIPVKKLAGTATQTSLSRTGKEIKRSYKFMKVDVAPAAMELLRMVFSRTKSKEQLEKEKKAKEEKAKKAAVMKANVSQFQESYSTYQAAKMQQRAFTQNRLGVVGMGAEERNKVNQMNLSYEGEHYHQDFETALALARQKEQAEQAKKKQAVAATSKKGGLIQTMGNEADEAKFSSSKHAAG